MFMHFNLWNTFKNNMLQAFDEVCEKKKGKRKHGDTWCWNEEIKEAIQLKKVTYTCRRDVQKSIGGKQG